MKTFLIKKSTKTRVDDQEVRRATGLVVSPIEAVHLLGTDYAVVVETDPPPHEPWQQLQEVEPEFHNNEWQQRWSVINPPLEIMREIKQHEIQTGYLRRETLPVEHLGRQWKGGSSSGQGIRDAAEISAQLELETVELWDINNDSQHYTLAEARQIAAVIGVAYQQLFAQRAGLLKAISDAETVEAVLAVGWGAGA